MFPRTRPRWDAARCRPSARSLAETVVARLWKPWDTAERTQPGRPSEVIAVACRPATPGLYAEDRRRLMIQLFAAIGATVAAIVELSLVPYLRIGDAHPHPVLVFGVIWAIAAGLEAGLIWAVVGGILLDSLASRPFGASVFALVVSVGLALLIARTFIRIRPLAPVIAVPILSLVYSVVLMSLVAAIRPPVSVADPAASLMPGAAYDAVLGLLFGPLALSIRDRRRQEERVDW